MSEYAVVDWLRDRLTWRRCRGWVYAFLAGVFVGVLIMEWQFERRVEPRLASVAQKVLAIEAARMECERELDAVLGQCMGVGETGR